jgi:hypothetical protein
MRSDKAALDQLVRSLFEQVTILERPRLVFSRIANEISFPDPVIQNLIPLRPGRESRSTAPPKAGLFQLIHHILGAQFLEALLPSLIPTNFQVGINVGGMAVELLENPWFCGFHE